MKTADAFTTVRIALAPLVFLLYFIPLWTNSFFGISVFLLIPIIAFAEFTDFLDGYFARRQNEVSDFGKLFDPFADVFFHLTLFVCFAFSGYLPVPIFALVLYREFGMLFLRMLALKRGVAIGARWGGKIKTVLYVVAAFYSLLLECSRRLQLFSFDASLWRTFMYVGIGLYCLALAASYLSFTDYLLQCRALFSSDKKK